jgi:hypothetical protein
MKFFLSTVLMFLSLGLFAQRKQEINTIKQKLQYKKNKIYLVCRGTSSKSRLIAYKFNITDTNITHVGVAFLNKGELFIYNVTDNTLSPTSRNALRIDSLASFVSSLDVYYLSLWEYNSTKKEVRKLKKACMAVSKRKIFFDASFKINNDDTLYCSEFCVAVLERTNSMEFIYSPTTKPLNNKLYETILQRQTLTYYPVDFFQINNKFTKVFDYTFKKAGVLNEN